MKRHARKRSANRPSSASETGFGNVTGLLKSSAMGIGGGILSACLLALIGTAVCAYSSDPHGLILPLGLIALYLASMIGGWITLRCHKSAPLLCGAVSGGGTLLLVFLVSLFLGKSGDSSLSLGLSLLLHTLIPFFSVLGARMGVKRRTAPGRAKRKR